MGHIRHMVFASLTLTTLATAATITVTSTADTNTAGTLRNAIGVSAPGDLINFNCGNPCTIALTAPLPVINHSLTINGTALQANRPIIDGAGQFRAFFVDTGTVSLSNLVIQNVRAKGGDGGSPGGGGGGLGAGAGLFVNQATANVTVTNCAFINNTALGGSGNSGTAGGGGGGLLFNGGGWGGAFVSSGGGGGGFLAAGTAGSAGTSAAGGAGGAGGGGGGGGAYAGGAAGGGGAAAFASGDAGLAGAAGSGVNGGNGGAGGSAGGGGGGGDSNAANGQGGQGGAGGFGGGGGGGGMAIATGGVGGQGGAGGPGGGGGAGGTGNPATALNGAGGAGGKLTAAVHGGEGGDGGAGGGAGGAAAGPAIFVRAGTLTTTGSTASGATVTAGPHAGLHSEDGTVDATPVFNFGGTVNGSPGAGPVPAALGTAPTTLAVSVSHVGNFFPFQSPATYTITVTNTGAAATSGNLVVTENIPVGMILTSMTSTGCTFLGLPHQTCVRGTPLAAGQSFTVTANVDVSGTPPASVTNVVGAAAGNATSFVAADPTTISGGGGGGGGGCSTSLSPDASFGNGGGTGTITVTIAAGCAWTAVSNAGFITITGGATGSGNGTVSFSVAANAGASRVGTVTVGASTFTITQGGTVSAGPALRFVPVTPCRVADTRNPTGPFGGPLMSGPVTRNFDIPSSGCGIPSTALAYSLNVTVVPVGPLGFLSIWPAGQPQPLVSTLNSDGRVKANAAIVPAGVGGGVSVFVSNSSHVILDINGYFVAASGSNNLAFYSITPCRLSDTRSPAGTFGGPALAANVARAYPVTSGGCGIPASAQAYVVNMTVVPSAPLGFLATWPAGQPQPVVSTLNAPTGAITANMAIVPAGASGAISVLATTTTELIIDITGYFAPPGAGGSMDFFTATPCRIADTRNPAGSFGGPQMSANLARAFAVPQSACNIPATAKAYSLNATVVPSGPLGFLALWGSGAQPLVSTLNSSDGSIVANAAITPAGAAGVVTASPSGATQLILDINGYFQ